MNEHETIDDILREMRDEQRNDFLTNSDLRHLADRIEAAAKRDQVRGNATAPARNCDRFASAEEATAAFGGVLPDDIGDHRAFVAWLFAPAEGGAE